MSNIQYGLISEVDKATIEKTLDLICEQFPSQAIGTCEVGVYGGMTSEGIMKYLSLEKHRICNHIGIDNLNDGETPKHFPIDLAALIIGNSTEVYNKLPDESQHFILLDALHTFPAVVADYYCYAPKVKRGGFLAFHDTSPQAQGKDWQRVGDKNDPDMYIAVNKALEAIGLLDKHLCEVLGWQLVFSEYDEHDAAGGITVFKKL